MAQYESETGGHLADVGIISILHVVNRDCHGEPGG
jgi:hypothetical protein